MPFQTVPSTGLHLPPLTEAKSLDKQGLQHLLCGCFGDNESWLSETKQLLWGSDRVPEVSFYQILNCVAGMYTFKEAILIGL